MSLVNDMLRSLEQREGIQQDNIDELGCITSANSMEEPEQNVDEGLQWLWGRVFSIALLAIVSGYGIQFLVEKNTLVSAQSMTEKVYSPIIEAPQTKKTATTALGHDVAEINSEVTIPDLLPENNVADQSAAIKARINRLLAEGKLALLNDRLTDPVADNAFSRFQSVLAIDPQHKEALTGLETIASRYFEFSLQTYQRGEYTKAQNYLAMADLVANQYPSVQFWLEERKKNVLWIAELESIENVAGSNIDSEYSSDSPAQDNLPRVSLPSSDNEERLSVKPSRQTQDRNISDKAAVLMAEQRWGEAEQLLTQALDNYPELKQSKHQLFSLYLLSRQRQKAEQMLPSFVNISHSERLLMKARLAIQFQEWEQAVGLLELNQGDSEFDMESSTLLAAVYHKLGDHQNSVNQYQALLEVEQNNASFWLGLAVSLDALADKSGALRAYRFARLYGGLDSSTQLYVKQRIDVLSLALTTVKAG